MSTLHTIAIATGTLDLLEGIARLHRGDVALTPIEVAALTVLAEAMPEPVSESELLQRAWAYKSTKTRAVSVGLSRLRAKIEDDPRSPQVLQTVRGQGYRLIARQAKPAAARVNNERCDGRSEDQQRLTVLSSSERIIEVIGPGGIGKSTLVRSITSEAIWVPLRGVTLLAGLLRRLCAALSIEAANPEEALRAAITSVPGLVLDGGEGLASDARQWLASWLTGAQSCTWITTREPLGLGARFMLGPLQPTQARALIAHARERMGLGPAPESAVVDVLDKIGGHPLALSVVAPLLELLPDAEALLSLAADGITVGEVLTQTLGLLAEDARALLALAAVCATPQSLTSLQALSGLALPDLLRSLHQLRERGLVRLVDGHVEVPAFLQRVAPDAAARARHGAWAASQLADPVALSAVRHELEHALEHAEPIDLAPLLIRHIVVLHSYGPTDRLQEDVLRLAPQIPDEGRREVVLGALLEATGDRAAAYDAFLRSLELLDEDDGTFRGWAWLWLSIAASWRNEATPAGQSPADALLALRGRVDDVALWASMTINAASWTEPTDPAGAAALYAEVAGHEERLPSLALTAGFYRLGADVPTLTAVGVMEQRLATVGEARLGRRRWVQHHLRLGRAYMRVLALDRGMLLLETYAEEALQAEPRTAANTLSMAAAHVLDHPGIANKLLSWVGEAPWAPALRWLLAGCPGDPPSGEPQFAELLRAVRDGHAVAVASPYVAFGRAMRLLQQRGYRMDRR